MEHDTQTPELLTELLQNKFGLAPRFASAIVPGVLDEFVVIPRSEIPNVIETGANLRVGPIHFVSDRDAASRYGEALQYLALSFHHEAREAEAAVAEAKRNQRRNQRRDELAVEAGGPHVAWTDMGPTARNLADKLIEAEDQIARLEAQVSA